MRLLVTGGSGFVGAGILRRAPREWDSAATYLTHPIEQPGVAAFCVNLCNADAVHRLFAAVRPEVVIHTAARMSGAAMMATNIEGTRNVARAAQHHRALLIHLSSDVIFDGEHAPYTEDDPPAPITPYGESKARAEQMVQATHENAVIVRTSLVYGLAPMDPRTRQTLNGEMPYLFTDEYRCPIFVDDLADALIEIARLRQGTRRDHDEAIHVPCELPPSVRNDTRVLILNIAGPQRLSRYEFGLKLARAFHSAPKFAPALAASHPSPRPRDCTLTIARAQKILRTKLRSVDEVLTGH